MKRGWSKRYTDRWHSFPWKLKIVTVWEVHVFEPLGNQYVVTKNPRYWMLDTWCRWLWEQKVGEEDAYLPSISAHGSCWPSIQLYGTIWCYNLKQFGTKLSPHSCVFCCDIYEKKHLRVVQHGLAQENHTFEVWTERQIYDSKSVRRQRIW